jgi:rod shape-determining protein MreC
MVSLFTITVDYRGGRSGPFEVAGREALSLVGALQGGVSKVIHPVGAFFSGLAHIGTLQSENHRLKIEVQKLRGEAAHNTSLERQYSQLVGIFNLKESLGLTGVAAAVIGESPGNFEWSVTINRGQADGLKRDMPVLSGDGLVGHVVEVTAHVSKIQLIIDPNSAVAARLAISGETGLAIGQRDRPLTMDLVNPDSKVTLGEQVVTSGYQGGLYPPEIIVGVVSHIYQQQGGLTKVIDVSPSVDFSSLESVLVVTGHVKATTKKGPPLP